MLGVSVTVFLTPKQNLTQILRSFTNSLLPQSWFEKLNGASDQHETQWLAQFMASLQGHSNSI
jgi:hypothetical protein